MTVHEFRLPDLGEGLTESEIVEWHVAVGDRVALNQTIADVETAKAIVQLPSPFAGVVAALLVEPGMTVQVGAPIVSIEVAADAALASAPESEPEPSEAPAPRTAAPTEAAPATVDEPEVAAEAAPAAERQSVLVGYGPALESGSRPKRKRRTLPERVANISSRSAQVFVSSGSGRMVVMTSPCSSGRRLMSALPVPCGVAAGSRRTFMR